MPIINLKKFYYPYYTKDTFIEVSDEVAEALLKLTRQENNQAHKIWYHKAYFSLDCEDGIENHALNWEQPSPEDYMILAEEEATHKLLLEHLQEALSVPTPTQASRIHAHYMLGMTVREIAAAEGVDTSAIYESIKGGLKKIQRYFYKHKWRESEE